MLANLMDGNVAAGFILNVFIGTNMIAVAMGADDEANICKIDSQP